MQGIKKQLPYNKQPAVTIYSLLDYAIYSDDSDIRVITQGQATAQLVSHSKTLESTACHD